MASEPRPGVFLDRDGTVIVDRHYPGDPDAVELLPGAAEAVARLNRAGLPVLLVTNQSGIGRGLISEADFHAVQLRVQELLAAAGARVDGVYHCPHAPDAEPRCECRKPLTGLFRRAAAEHAVAPERSWFVGDRSRDVLPGLELGGMAMLLTGTREGAETEEVPPQVLRVATLGEAVERILGPHG